MSAYLPNSYKYAYNFTIFLFGYTIYIIYSSWLCAKILVRPQVYALCNDAKKIFWRNCFVRKLTKENISLSLDNQYPILKICQKLQGDMWGQGNLHSVQIKEKIS